MSGGGPQPSHAHAHISFCLFGTPKSGQVYAPIVDVPEQIRHVNAGKTSCVKRFYKSCQDLELTNKTLSTVYEYIDSSVLVVHTEKEEQELFTLPAFTDGMMLDTDSLEVVAEHYGKVSMSPNSFVEATVTMLMHYHSNATLAHQRFREQFSFLQSRKRDRGNKRFKDLIGRIDTEFGRFKVKATQRQTSQSSRIFNVATRPPPR